jgi:hypothetical protein
MQYAALHGPRRMVMRTMHISRAEAKRQGYTGPRFRLMLECGHTVARLLVRDALYVKCGECMGEGYNSKGFKR